MHLVAQIVLNGVLLGGLYACMALGFSIVWGVMNVVNLAYGSMIMLGAYVCWLGVLQLGLPIAAAALLAALALFCLGYLLQWTLLNRLAEKSVFMTLIFTFGLNMALINLNLLAFSADVRSLPEVFGRGVVELGGLRVPEGRAVIFGVAMAMTIGLHFLLNATKLGNAIKATSFDPGAARLSGIDVPRVYSLTFGIGGAMAGLTGALVAMSYSFSPIAGESFTMKAFVVVVLGGLGSVPGAIVGGISLGIAENLASLFLDSGYRDVVGFSLLLLVLVLRPRGLLGKQFFAEVRT
jgi:branched-chain amino acid transport system permease protein